MCREWWDLGGVDIRWIRTVSGSVFRFEFSIITTARSFIIPGGPGRLEKICLGEDNLMLIYTNDMARLWDVKTQEFWRSMTRDKAEELLEQGGWFET
jgi:hypothetical protein